MVCEGVPAGGEDDFVVLREVGTKPTFDFAFKDHSELGQELESLLKAQFGLRMQRATQQLTNHSQFRKVRRDIARVLTIASQKRAGSPASGKTKSKTGA